MTYDIHGSWDSITGHQSPIYDNSPGYVLPRPHKNWRNQNRQINEDGNNLSTENNNHYSYRLGGGLNSTVGVSVHSAVMAWMAGGCAASQINIGVPFYGRVFNCIISCLIVSFIRFVESLS